MEKQEYKSKWDELAREIGAEIPPETEQREQAVSTIAESGTSQPKRKEPVAETVLPPLPKKQPADWNLLAGELGLPPVPYEEPVVAEKPPQSPQRPAFRESLTPAPKPERIEQPEQQESSRPRREESRERGDRGERGGRGGQRRGSQGQDRERSGPRRGSGRGRSEETGQAREEGGRGRQEGGRGREETNRGRDDQRRRREPREADDRPPMEVTEEVIEVESIQVERPAPSPPEPPPKPPAVSLWHKIFGSPAEQTAKLPEPDTIEPAWNDDLRNETSTEVRDDSIAPADDDVATGEFDDRPRRGERKSIAEGEATSEERSRGRSRRRRRGGRGRKSGERPAERSAAPLQQEAEGIDDLGVEFADADDDADESASFEDGMERPGTDLDIDDPDGDSDELGGRGKSAAQRAIPSWDDAIGFIVDSNMQTRSQRRPAPRSGNSPRGRSRGRRRD